MDEDVLGLWALHRLASQFGDGLKTELLYHLCNTRAQDVAPNVVDCAALFLPRGVENRSLDAPKTSASIVCIADLGAASRRHVSVADHADPVEREAKA